MAVIDVGLLYLLKDAPGFNIYLARVVSYPTAMAVGYVLNRFFTFHHIDSSRALWKDLLRFFSVHSLGGALNFAVFTLVIEFGKRLELTELASALLPLVAVWLGGVVGMCLNFVLARRLVFRN